MAHLIPAIAMLTAVSFVPAEAQPSAQNLTTATPVGGFDRTLSLQGVNFHVTCAQSSSLNRVRIQPQGLKGENAVIEANADGTVTDAEVADLNGDGFPEIYIHVTSAGSGSYGTLIAYGSNKNRSLTEIYLPPLEEDPKAVAGYQGHDEFAVAENALVRRFPIYKKNDTQAQPSGGTRQVQYHLVAGEAGWILRAYRVVQY
jgi:hypothetical protein